MSHNRFLKRKTLSNALYASIISVAFLAGSNAFGQVNNGIAAGNNNNNNNGQQQAVANTAQLGLGAGQVGTASSTSAAPISNSALVDSVMANSSSGISAAR